jgi:HEPN domain-containing protein
VHLQYGAVLTTKELREIARARLGDAEALFAAKRYEGAMYVCGYAVEIALKARVCKTLKWPDFPSTEKEFQSNTKYRFLKTHSLEVLLSYSGQENKTKTRFMTQWSAVAAWSPDSRYKPVTKASRASARDIAKLEAEAQLMIDSAKVLMREL